MFDRNSETRLIESEAVKVIQRAWRRHMDVQVFHYYKKLIDFQSKGDPFSMLKAINPREAELVDPAAGLHIRFRLGGEKFPPSLYFKVFTHRPVQDMCANSPKNYTTEALLDAVPNHCSVPVPNIATNPKDGWYQRIENNGWRLVSRRFISTATDGIVATSHNQRGAFAPLNLTRREDAARRRKQRKVKWLKKMYKEGMVKAKGAGTEEQGAKQLIEGAAQGMVRVLDENGVGAVEEWEIDQLLQWTTALNFDHYLNSWNCLATTESSDNNVRLRHSWVLYDTVPLELITPDIGEFDDQDRNIGRRSHPTPVPDSPSPIQSTS